MNPLYDLREIFSEEIRHYLGQDDPICGPNGPICEITRRPYEADAPIDLWFIDSGDFYRLVRNDPKEYSSLTDEILAMYASEKKWTFFQRAYGRILTRALNAGLISQRYLDWLTGIHSYSIVHRMFAENDEPLKPFAARMLDKCADVPPMNNVMVVAVKDDGSKSSIQMRV
jgi:hypothetical protein